MTLLKQKGTETIQQLDCANAKLTGHMSNYKSKPNQGNFEEERMHGSKWKKVSVMRKYFLVKLK